MRNLRPHARAMRHEQDRQNPWLFGIAPGFEFLSETVQIRIVDDAEIEYFFEWLAWLMLAD
jgi:hypothetical protein